MDTAGLAVTASALSAALGMLWVLNLRRNRVAERVRIYAGTPHQASLTEAGRAREQAKSNAGENKTAPRVRTASGWMRRLEREMAQADIPLKPREYLMLQSLVSLVPGMMIYMLSGRLLPAVEWVSLSLLLPLILLRGVRAKRIVAFDRQLGDCLGTMANSLRAGFGFLQAMEMISREAAPPLCTEMARTLRETNLGVPVEEALRHLGGRVASEDLELLINAVVIQRQVGGNLAEILDRIAHTITERSRIRGEIKTLTAQGRISGLVIGTLPFALAGFLATISPTYLGAMFKHPLGWLMVVVGLVGETAGLLIIRKVVSLDV